MRPLDPAPDRVAVADPRSPGTWEVPARLPDPHGGDRRDLVDVVLAMALEAGRLRALFSGTSGPRDERLAALLPAGGDGALAALWREAVLEVCAAYRVGALTAADAVDRGEDDTFASLTALCAALLGWLTWCARLPFAAPGELPGGAATVAYRHAARGGDPARTAVAVYTAVLTAAR